MVIFTEKGNDRSIRYNQDNNVIELFLKKLKAQQQSTYHRESCAPESGACAVESVGGTWKYEMPVCPVSGKAFIGQGDNIFNYLNSDEGGKSIPVNSPTYPNNEFIENISFAIEHFSDCKAELKKFRSPLQLVPELQKAIEEKCACVIHYRTDYGSGHYVTIVGYDVGKSLFKIVDPFGGSVHCKNGGWHEDYDHKFLTDRTRLTFLKVSKK